MNSFIGLVCAKLCKMVIARAAVSKILFIEVISLSYSTANIMIFVQYIHFVYLKSIFTYKKYTVYVDKSITFAAEIY